MVYGPFSLSRATEAEVTFHFWAKTERGYDWLSWMASIDGENFYGQGGSGDSGGWREETFDLSNVYRLGNLLGKPAVWIAFVFTSDSSISAGEGALVDDIVLRTSTGSAGIPVVITSTPASNEDYSNLPRFPADIVFSPVHHVRVGFSPAEDEYEAGTILVQLKADVPKAAVQILLGEKALQVLGEIPRIGVLRLAVPVGKELEIVAELQDNPLIECAEPNYIAHASR
jgi:hypothetical protein